jgi:hypothetical protein
MKIAELVPPVELCKQIPSGKFEDSCFVWVNGMDKQPKPICRPWDKKSTAAPAPTLQEILEDLHKHEKDVFLKWSEIAYNEWLINAYTTPVRDIQAHNQNIVTAAIKVWLELKGIKNE